MATYLPPSDRAGGDDSYLIGRGPAWFAFAMTLALMLFDYIDRQVIVSLFPYMKADWGLSDKQLGALVSVVSVTVALGALPVALIADRASRVKSIVVMATAWSLATISCMFTRNYGQLLAARAVVGLGEAGYGSVGAALIASVFPARMRGTLLAAFFATASVGSVLGVLLGGLIAARWGWQAAFGVVGFPGLVLALLYLKVRDYKTVALTPALNEATRSTGSTVAFVAKFAWSSRARCSGSAWAAPRSWWWCRRCGRGCPASSTASTACRRSRRRCARPWWCWSAPSAACSGATWSTAPARAARASSCSSWPRSALPRCSCCCRPSRPPARPA